MKMIWAVIRPESAGRVINALDRAGVRGMTRIHVTGHGKRWELPLPQSTTRKIPKELLMIVVPDNEVAKTVMIIRAEAKTMSKSLLKKNYRFLPFFTGRCPRNFLYIFILIVGFCLDETKALFVSNSRESKYSSHADTPVSIFQ